MTQLLGLGPQHTDVSAWGFVLITSLAVSDCPSEDTVLRRSCLGSGSLTPSTAGKPQPSHALGAKQSQTRGMLPHLPLF